jgi:psp operon transcriptional activator
MCALAFTQPDTQQALGQSDVFLRFQEQLSLAARADRPVLLVGERGTGKELAAVRLHYLSPRWQGPLETLNCAAVPAALAEAELFGHEPGAFTGAAARRAGRFEAAHQGTLVLDELARLPRAAQAKILRVVEQQTFERLGSTRSLAVDVRVVGATNQDLPALAGSGKFLPDLLDRLSFEVLTLPPLRERGDDVLLLAEHFAARFAAEQGLEPPVLGDAAVGLLRSHEWPGNVRELKNAVERAVHRAGGGEVQDVPLDPFDSPYRPAPAAGPDVVEESPPCPARPGPLPDFKEAVAAREAELVREALDRARHNRRAAAELLGLSYHQLRGLLRKHKQRVESGKACSEIPDRE